MDCKVSDGLSADKARKSVEWLADRIEPGGHAGLRWPAGGLTPDVALTERVRQLEAITGTCGEGLFTDLRLEQESEDAESGSQATTRYKVRVNFTTNHSPIIKLKR